MLQLWIQQRYGGNVRPQGNVAESPIHFRLGSRSSATATRRLESYYAPRDPDSFNLRTDSIPQSVSNSFATSSTLRRVVSMWLRSTSIPVNPDEPRCLRAEIVARGRMPPLEDDDALVVSIIDEKAAAAGSYMTHSLPSYRNGIHRSEGLCRSQY
jgi:hypothetical protein